MAVIKVSPEMLRKNATRMNQIRSMNGDLSNKLSEATSLLDNSWDGSASVQMVQNFQEANNQIKHMTSSYSDAVDLLCQYASAFEKVGLNKNQITGWIIPRIKIHPSVFTVLGCPKISQGGDIRVVPNGLRESASAAKIASNTVKKIIDEICLVRNELSNNWQGNASQKFVKNLQNYITAYENLVNSLNEYAQEITMAVNDYERIDNME